MITHWNFLVALGLIMFAQTFARQDSYLSDGPAEEMYNELVDEVQRLHNQEINYVQYLGAMAARQQRQEDAIQQQQQQQELSLERKQDHQLQQSQPFGEETALSELDETVADSTDRNRIGHVHETPKPVSFPKSKYVKKSERPYMSLCHFKLCNIGRKRNTRFLHFWN